MIKLNEYIGSIKRDIAEARLISDLKTLEIAQQFAQNEYLKHFSIPRFKTENIELTIPIAIGEMSIETEVYERINLSEFMKKTRDKLISLVNRRFTSAEVEIIDSIIKPEASKLDKSIKEDTPNNEVDTLLKTYSYDVLELLLESFRISVKEDEEVLAGELIAYLRDDIKPVKPTQPSIPKPKVIVESSQLKDVNPEHIIHVKMILNEEPMEWSFSEDEDGKVVSKLLPE
ncbi:hypothetical protein [Tenacibaculum amylolyticum]|uniref:hypothetical protein n=1 Tax=Tenacibaculum amylolyticum TaxID=104269 RepID=UPI0038932259